MAMEQTSFTRDDLLACARGELFGPGNAQLPEPPPVTRMVLPDCFMGVGLSKGIGGPKHSKPRAGRLQGPARRDHLVV